MYQRFQALACPFAASHAHTLNIGETNGPCLSPPVVVSETIGPKTVGWVGEIATEKWGHWVDVYLLLIFGGIPWQVGFPVVDSRFARRCVIPSVKMLISVPLGARSAESKIAIPSLCI